MSVFGLVLVLNVPVTGAPSPWIVTRVGLVPHDISGGSVTMIFPFDGTLFATVNVTWIVVGSPKMY